MSPASPYESGNWPPTSADLYKSGRAATVCAYYRYDEQEPLQCPNCHWTGLAGDVTPEYYRDLFDVSCPSCDKMLLIVSYPTVEETKAAAAAGNPKAIADLPYVEKLEESWRMFDAVKLRSPEQLPTSTGRSSRFFGTRKCRARASGSP